MDQSRLGQFQKIGIQSFCPNDTVRRRQAPVTSGNEVHHEVKYTQTLPLGSPDSVCG